MTAHRGALSLVSLFILLFFRNDASEAATPGGTVLRNVVSASYSDSNRVSYATISNEIVMTVAAVGALLVSPKETGCNAQTDVFASGMTFKRTFTVSNVSNVADAYSIASATTTGGKIATLAFVAPDGTSVPANVGAVSASVQPGSSIQVQVSISTSGVAVGTQISIGLSMRTTAAGTANGLQTDSAQQCGIAAAGAAFTQTGVVNAILKLVDGATVKQIHTATVVHYSIAFTNTGGMPAYNAGLSDNLPTGIQVDPSSVKLNGVALPSGGVAWSGSTLGVALGTIAPQTPQVVTFDAALTSVPALGTTLTNIASVAADDATPAKTTPAALFIGDANVIYDGDAGGAAPIANATIQIIDPSTGNVITPGIQGTTPPPHSRRMRRS